MKKTILSCAFFLSSACLPVLAQHHGQGHHAGAGHASAYAGMQGRGIKALSEQQVEGLQSGKGMGLAMAAELNGYPGPLHVLELQSQLQLSAAQVERTRQLYAQMQSQAIQAGARVIAAERELDALFAQKQATAQNVAAAVAQAAAEQGRLRETHLRYHLAMMELLSAEQVAAYQQLRGY